MEELESGVELTKLNGKTYSPEMRMKVYDAIVAGVPTKNIPSLIAKFAHRSGKTLKNVTHRSTVEAMARELGAISDLQAAEAFLANRDCTIGFDATTQEGMHLNSVHITTEVNCYVNAADVLPRTTIYTSVSQLITWPMCTVISWTRTIRSPGFNFKCFKQHD